MSGFRSLPPLAFALALLAGHVTDKTTGQPLAGVSVDLEGPQRAHATTDTSGAYTVRGVKPGRYTVTLSSEDVPPQHFALTIGSTGTTKGDFVACSTTLDYSCAPSF
jgi:protocatechuate 3,4-dioxygenase beta subunit